VLFGTRSSYLIELEEMVEDAGLSAVKLDDENPEQISAYLSEVSRTERKDGRKFLISSGDPGTRRVLFRAAIKLGFEPHQYVAHSSSSVSQSASIGDGTHINRLTSIASQVVIGRNVLLNRSCSVGHDSRVHDHVSFGAGVILSANVTVHEGARLGAGCVFRPGVVVGAGAIVGAGAAVVKDVSPGATVFGNPASPEGRGQTPPSQAGGEVL